MDINSASIISTKLPKRVHNTKHAIYTTSYIKQFSTQVGPHAAALTCSSIERYATTMLSTRPFIVNVHCCNEPHQQSEFQHPICLLKGQSTNIGFYYFNNRDL